MKWLLLLMPCFQQINNPVRFWYCDASVKHVEDCRMIRFEKLATEDLRSAIEFVANKKGWVRNDCPGGGLQ